MSSTNVKVRIDGAEDFPAANFKSTARKEKEAQAELKRLRDFGLVMSLALSVLAGIMIYKGRLELALWLSIVSVFFTVPAIGAPKVLRPLEKRWMVLAEKMGLVITAFIVAVTYFCVVTPIALLARLVGKQFLALRFDASRSSYWEPVEPDGPGTRHYLPY